MLDREEVTGTVTGGEAPGGEPLPGLGLRGRLNEAAAWLARASSNRWLSLGLVAVIVLIDRVLLSGPFGFLARAVMDEPSHLLTGFVLLGTITRWLGRPPSRPFAWALLIGSVAIDIDHLPAELAASGLLYGNLPRPYTHALWLLLVLVLATGVAAGRARLSGQARAGVAASILAGASWGLAAHFLRDVATAPIALLWPVSGTWLQVPYGWYLAAMLVLVALPLKSPQPRA